jgi:SAM-dependent methyltransferase
MPSDTPDFSSRAQLTELMDEPCSREELRTCLRDIARLNRWFLGYRPVLRWLDSLALQPGSPPVQILDVGCGYGDGLRRVAKWASEHAVAAEFTGLDINPDTVSIAQEASPAECGIRWVSKDIFAYDPDRPVDIVTSSLFAHHLTDEEIVRFLRWMEERANIGWFINDLSRNSVPYYLLKAFSRVARLHHFVQHDAPVSIARAFVPQDWRRLCAAAGLAERDITIHGFSPARLCVARRRPR